MKGLSYVRSRGTAARGGLVLRHADGHGPGGRAPGLLDRAVPGTPAGKGSRVCRSYGQTHRPAEDGGRGDRTGAGRHAAEAGRRTARRGRRRGQSPGQGVSRGRYGRVAARERERRPDRRPAMRRDRDAGDTEAPRCRVEGPEPGERGDAGGGGGRGKGPGRRPAAPVRQGWDASDRPSAPGVFARLDDMLARHRAGRPPAAATPGSGLTGTPGHVSGWPGRSPLPRAGTGTAGSRPCPEPASRRRRSAGSWPGMGSWRTRPNGAGTVPARARRLPRPTAWPTGTSRPNGRTGSGPRTSPGIRAGDGKACLSPPVDCHDGRIAAYTAGPGPDAGLADGMPAKAAESLPEGAHPLARSGRGRHRRRPGRPALMGRCGPARPTGAKGPLPGRRRRGGVLRTHEDGIRPSRASGGAYPRRGTRPGRRRHPLARPRAHQTAARLDESGTIQTKPRNGYMITSQKHPQPPPTRRRSRLTVRVQKSGLSHYGMR